MNRGLQDHVVEAYDADIFMEAVLCRLNIPSGNLFATDHTSDLLWRGNTYKGLGSLISFGSVEETIELSAKTLEIRLGGFPPDKIDILLNEKLQSRDGFIYRCTIDLDSNTIYGDPALILRGKLDTSTIIVEEESLTIAVNLRSVLADWDIPKAVRLNDASHRTRFPFDRGLEYAEVITEMDNIVWSPGD